MTISSSLPVCVPRVQSVLVSPKPLPLEDHMSRPVNRRRAMASILNTALLALVPANRFLATVQVQPLAAQVRRLIDAMAYLGEPFSDADRKRLEAAANLSDEARAVDEIQRILDPHCLLTVRINPESR